MSKAYNASEYVAPEKKKKLEEGTYTFLVEHAGWKTPRTKPDGSVGADYLGLELKLTNASREAKVYDNMFFTPASLWKIKSFMEAVGLDFSSEPDKDYMPILFAGKTGTAHFKAGENGFLVVAYYVNPAEVTDAPNSDSIPF
jgi:hypothetical protein